MNAQLLPVHTYRNHLDHMGHNFFQLTPFILSCVPDTLPVLERCVILINPPGLCYTINK